MKGNGGSLYLDGVNMSFNGGPGGPTAEPVRGSGLSIACDGGMVKVDGGVLDNNARAGIAVSAGSACSSGKAKASHDRLLDRLVASEFCTSAWRNLVLGEQAFHQGACP